MADAVDEKAVEYEDYTIVTCSSVSALNSQGMEMGGVTHIDIFKNPDGTFNVNVKGHLMLNRKSGEIFSIHDRLFVGQKEFGIKFSDKIVWWFTNPEKIIDPLMAHINFTIENWKTESQVEIIKCDRKILDYPIRG